MRDKRPIHDHETQHRPAPDPLTPTALAETLFLPACTLTLALWWTFVARLPGAVAPWAGFGFWAVMAGVALWPRPRHRS